MPPLPVFLETDNVTPFAGIVSGPIAGGSSSALYTAHLKNDGTDDLVDARLYVAAVAGGTTVGYGYPVVDERWTKMAITGYDDSGASSEMQPQTTGMIATGQYQEIPVATIPPGGIRVVQMRIDVPSGRSAAALEIKIFIAYNENSRPLAPGLSLATGAGIVPGYKDPSRRGIAWGREVTGSGTTSAAIAAGAMDYDGTRTGQASGTTGAISQNDSAASALAVGQSYIARVVQDSAGVVTIVKGVKSSGTPAPGAIPSGKLLLADITIHYGAGGTVINQADIDQSGLTRSDYVARAGTGRSVVISGGRAITATDLLLFHSADRIVGSLTDDATSYIWLLQNGDLLATDTSDLPEQAAQLIWSAVVASGVVTTLTDYRRYINSATSGESWTPQWEWNDSLSTVSVPQTIAPVRVLPWDGTLQQVTLDLDAPEGDWTGGNVKVDVVYFPPGSDSTGAGTSIFDPGDRPTLAYNVADGSLRATSSALLVTDFLEGTRFVPVLTGVPTAAAAEADHAIIIGMKFTQG